MILSNVKMDEKQMTHTNHWFVFGQLVEFSIIFLVIDVLNWSQYKIILTTTTTILALRNQNTMGAFQYYINHYLTKFIWLLYGWFFGMTTRNRTQPP